VGKSVERQKNNTSQRDRQIHSSKENPTDLFLLDRYKGLGVTKKNLFFGWVEKGYDRNINVK
jgi:hypothetical protein